MTFPPDEVNRLRIALGRISRTLDRHVNSGGLTRTELSVLGTAARLRQVSAGELAEIEGLNPTMLSRIVGKLEAAGLLTRSQEPEDRRVVRIAVTPQGSRLHNRLRRERTALLSDRLADLDDIDALALLAALPALESLAERMRPALVGSRR